MSLRGNMNKVAPGLMRAMQNAAMYGRVDNNGQAHGVQKIRGYVCGVHGFDDEKEELRGTVDVQETQYMGDEDAAEGVGFHEGVLCSAINDNSCGIWLMPSMYSDVVITRDPATMREYVLMYSHVDVVNLRSHKSMHIGVVETEDFQEGDDGPDVNELQETGNASSIDFDKDKIVETVKTKNGAITITKSASVVEVVVKDSVVNIKSDGSVEVKGKNITITGDKTEFKSGKLVKKGVANSDEQGAFCSIPVCPFTGAIHVGSVITE